MCTVTIIPCRKTWGGAARAPAGARGDAVEVRLACNRDEQRSRPAALRPRVRHFGNHRAILPIDPASGGTWIAVNDAGLALTLLNVCPPAGSGGGQPRPRSRGSIIPMLLHCATAEAAGWLTATLVPGDYAPFRLVIVDRRRILELCSDGREVRTLRRAPLTGPLLFTSSGLGDNVVAGPQRHLFEELLVRGHDWRRQQDAFHRHHWRDRPHLSVCMRRPEARTVSHTVVDFSGAAVAFTYYPGAPDEPVQPITWTLDLRRGGVRCCLRP